MNLSLIISIYRSPDFLEKVLESALRQSLEPGEIIVTEDGEDPRNAELLKRWPQVKHLTQRDQGNRKPLALNRALAASRGDYLVFIDGDCVLRSDFLEAHASLREAGTFLTGRRVELSPEMTEFLSAEKIRQGYLDSFTWRLYLDAVRGRTQSLGRMLRTPKVLRGILGREQIDDIRGCNFSVARQDLVAINGFSNDFSGAYGEDSDVELRLKFLGLRMKSVKGAAIQFHLWHKTQSKDQENQERLAAVARKGEARTLDGLAEIGRHP